METNINRSLQTLGVLVENKSGVLARVADLFARRGFNIHSLAVAPTTDPAFSRINICVNVESAPLEQVVKQLFKLVNVVEITELVLENAVERELYVAKLDLGSSETPDALIEMIKAASGTVLKELDNQITISVESNPSLIDAFEEKLNSDYDVISAARSGRIGVSKMGQKVPIHRISH